MIFILLSASLYIPLLWSIRKSGHLASAQVNHPQRYVLWQLVVIGIQKLVRTSPGMYEIILTPLIVQITYLGCNRRTSLHLLVAIRPTTLFKIFICPCLHTWRVEPVTREHTSAHT
uniref:Secreted protein n=1 Tax=Caenorhabditis tropicalis TaxID=1561998 RepID=A0A1I7TH66_9PELO